MRPKYNCSGEVLLVTRVVIVGVIDLQSLIFFQLLLELNQKLIKYLSLKKNKKGEGGEGRKTALNESPAEKVDNEFRRL